MLPRGHVYRYPPGSNMQNIQLAGVRGGMVTYGIGQQMPTQALASALANATPEQQRTVRTVSGFNFNTFGLNTHCFMRTRKLTYDSIVNGFVDAW